MPDSLFVSSVSKLPNKMNLNSSVIHVHPSLLNPHQLGIVPHQTNHRRAETKRRADRRTETDIRRLSMNECHSNLYLQLCGDLNAPYTRPNSTASDAKKDILGGSIAAVCTLTGSLSAIISSFLS